LRIDPVARRVFAHRKEVPASPREIALLEILAATPGETVSRQELVARLYGAAEGPESNVIDVLVCTLRKKLARAGLERAIHTRRGEGYLFYVYTEGRD
jgi:DNA-binding response OmpR family regulator